MPSVASHSLTSEHISWHVRICSVKYRMRTPGQKSRSAAAMRVRMYDLPPRRDVCSAVNIVRGMRMPYLRICRIMSADDIPARIFGAKHCITSRRNSFCRIVGGFPRASGRVQKCMIFANRSSGAICATRAASICTIASSARRSTRVGREYAPAITSQASVSVDR